jgi:hypothetical protein
MLSERVFLHRFHRPDDDRGPHNHPYTWSTSLILTGGYIESRVVGGGQVEEYGRFGRRTRHRGRLASKVYIAGDINRIPDADAFHRVAHLLDGASALGRGTFEPETWTLFMTGPKHGASWGYLIDWIYTPKRRAGGCQGCAYGTGICAEENVGTDEIPIYVGESGCGRPPKGWHCTREVNHEGPCAAWPEWML